MQYVVPFTELSKDHVDIAGGKGASLGEMTRSGIPVPPGFVVTAPAFDRFVEETDLIVEISAILGKVNVQEIHTIEHASEQIHALILNVAFPEDLGKSIIESFHGLGAEYVA